MNFLRRMVQFGAIAVLLLLPVISRGSALYEAYGPGARHVALMANPWELFLYKTYGFLFGWMGDPAAFTDGFQGSFWSITLFGYTFTDPSALIGHLAAKGAPYWPMVAGSLVSAVLALIAGRFFCGWLCPINTVLEFNAKLRAWLENRLLRQRLPRLVAPAVARWAVLLGTVLFSAAAGYNLFAFVLPYVGLARDWYLFTFGLAFGFGILFVAILISVELFLAPRLWCHGLCPTGLVLELIGKWRLLGIRRTAQGDCLTGCHACIAACPVGVNPRDEIDTGHCMMCNVCVTRCPTHVLELGANRRLFGGQVRGVATVVALAFLLASAPASAHHIKGMPHYGYLENYPQVPTRELRFPVPPYDVTVVAYILEGLDVSRSETPDDVMVYVSVTDHVTGKSHTGPLEVKLTPHGSGETVIRKFEKPVEETVYRLRATMPAPSYDVEVTIGDAGGVVGDGLLRIKDATFEPWLAAVAVAAGSVLLAVFLVVRRRSRSTLNNPARHGI